MAEKPEIEVDDAIVLLLGAPTTTGIRPGKLRGITRLEKLVFLMEQETTAKDWLTEKPEFVAYNFGPFSSKVYQAVDMLSAARLINDSGSSATTDEDTWEVANVIGGEIPANDPYATRDFELTPRGWKYFESLQSDLSSDELEELSQLKQRFASLPLRQLVRYVYEKYREFTERSIIRDQILGPE